LAAIVALINPYNCLGVLTVALPAGASELRANNRYSLRGPTRYDVDERVFKKS
jgi:hypothetical protein